VWQLARPPSEPPPLGGCGVLFETIPPARLRRASPQGRKRAPKARGNVRKKRGEKGGGCITEGGSCQHSKSTQTFATDRCLVRPLRRLCGKPGTVRSQLCLQLADELHLTAIFMLQLRDGQASERDKTGAGWANWVDGRGNFFFL
jgi:hypothetical protein